jgi:hypothetical protein
VHGPGKWSAAEIDRARNHRYEVHRATLKLKPPVNWARDPYGSRRFRGALNTLGWLDVLFYDFRMNGRRKSLRQARDLALDWIRANPPGSRRTDRTWDDRISATRATYLAYAMRASGCRGLLNRAKKRRLSRAIVHHGQLAASSKHYRPTNHGLFVDTNLILLNRAVANLAEGRGWGKKAKRRFGRTLRGRVIEDEGFWLEHSAFYQLAIRKEVEFFRKLVDGGALRPLYRRMTDVAGWFVEPDDRLVLLGSTNQKTVPQDIRQEAAGDAGLRWLRRSGLAFVKSAGAYLSFAATFFNGSHKHSDDLSFDLYDAGRRIVTDSGEYDKDGGRWGRFAVSPQAHSTLTVDAKGFGRDGRRSYGSGMLARGRGDGWFAILGNNPLTRRHGAGHERLMLYRPGLALLVVDRVRSRGLHTYRRYFQLAPGITADRAAKGVELSDGAWHGRLEDETRRGDPRLSLVRGKRDPILGFEFPQFRQRVARPVAVLRTTGRDLDHLAALGVDPSRPVEAKLIRANLGRTTVRLSVAGGPPSLVDVRRADRSLDVSVEP